MLDILTQNIIQTYNSVHCTAAQLPCATSSYGVIGPYFLRTIMVLQLNSRGTVAAPCATTTDSSTNDSQNLVPTTHTAQPGSSVTHCTTWEQRHTLHNLGVTSHTRQTGSSVTHCPNNESSCTPIVFETCNLEKWRNSMASWSPDLSAIFRVTLMAKCSSVELVQRKCWK